MGSFRRFTISKKINTAILSTTIAAVLIVGVAIGVFEYVTVRRAAMDNLIVMSKIIGGNCTGALAFRDSTAADRTLATLKDYNGIVASRIFTENGAVFATYVSTKSIGLSAGVPDQAVEQMRRVTVRTLQIFEPIIFNGDRIGTIFMEFSLNVVYRRILRYSIIVLIVIALMLPIVFLISRAFQKIIAFPIRDLAGVAKQIADQKNYAIRAHQPENNYGNDEVAQMTVTFNEMLQTIENRNENLVRQAEELGRSNRDLEQFAYISSHDLQEPLRKIETYAQLLEERFQKDPDPDIKKYISYLTTSAARMRMLIQDVLAYSQLNKPEIVTEDVNLNDTVKQILNEMEDVLKEKFVAVSVGSLPTVRANPSQMYQLFQNLISNAVKFRPQHDARINIKAERGHDEWRMLVQDNGIGISPKYQELIFKVFQRLHKASEYQGTGIGLAICKKIVERMGGRIWVESEIGKGSTFFFTLPKN